MLYWYNIMTKTKNNSKKESKLKTALQSRNVEQVLHYIQEGVWVDHYVRENGGGTHPFHLAATSGNNELYNIIKEKEPNYNSARIAPYIHTAIKNNNTDIARFMIRDYAVELFNQNPSTVRSTLELAVNAQDPVLIATIVEAIEGPVLTKIRSNITFNLFADCLYQLHPSRSAAVIARNLPRFVHARSVLNHQLNKRSTAYNRELKRYRDYHQAVDYREDIAILPQSIVNDYLFVLMKLVKEGDDEKQTLFASLLFVLHQTYSNQSLKEVGAELGWSASDCHTVINNVDTSYVDNPGTLAAHRI